MQEGKPYLRTPALSPDGQTLTFVYANDIWLAPIAGGNAERLTAHPAANVSPRFSPDGSLLAFTSSRTGRGDIYVLPFDSGEVRRLTHHGRYCGVQDWSADGQHLYFTSDRDHQGQAIYRVPLAGSTPALIAAEPFESLAHASLAPDGQTLAFNVVRRRWWRNGPDPFSPCDIWLGPPIPARSEQATDAALPRKIVGTGTPHHHAGLNRWPLWAADGSGLYFVSDRDGVENIWYQSLDGELRQVTHFTEGRVLWPAIARRAHRLVFERDWHIWQLDLDSGEAASVDIRVRPDTKLTPVYVETRTRGLSELCLSPDGKKIAFAVHGEIFADFADKETDKEQRQGSSFRVTNTSAREGQIAWTPDSRSLVYISDRHGENELYRYDFVTRSETRLTSDAAPKWIPRCSPDGRWVAYVRGNDAIYLLNLKTGTAHPFAQGSFIFSSSLAWSPDSHWLAYISHDSRFFSNVYVQHITETHSRQITFLRNILGGDLLWSPDGRFLVFTSGQYRKESQIARVDLRPPEPWFRETEFEKLFEESKQEKSQGNGSPSDAGQEKPAEDGDTPAEDPEEAAAYQEQGSEETEEDGEISAPQDTDEEDESSAPAEGEPKPEKAPASEQTVNIVFEGIERRLRFLTPIQMDADVQDISHNSRDLLFRAVVADKVNIWSLPLDEPRQDTPPRQLTANSSSKREAQFASNGKLFYYLEDGQIIIRKFPYGNEPTTLQVRGEVQVDFHQEKLQIFGEAWRLLRDTFYDPSFRGKDWHALREQFTPLAMGAQTHGELLNVLNLMVGELGASHLGAYWYSGGWSNDGYTGLLFDPAEQIEHGRLRVAALVPDSPVLLVAEPPRVGEYLIAVDGMPITSETNLDELLQRTIGRRVILRLAATPEGSGARDLAVRPVDGEDYSRLCYRAWVAANKAYVHRLSGGRLGYVHVEEMSYSAYQQFLVDLDAETHSKEGVLLDIRYNGGGHISTFILDVLARRHVLLSSFRNHLITDPYHLAGNRTLQKPTILVTNEASSSDAEIFTELYHRLGLGKVVGRPTAGRVIGTVSWWLLNGSYFRLPIYSYSTPEGENLEGTGRMVDIDIERPVGEWDNGKDRQLDAAVAALLESLDEQQEHL